MQTDFALILSVFYFIILLHYLLVFFSISSFYFLISYLYKTITKVSSQQVDHIRGKILKLRSDELLLTSLPL